MWRELEALSRLVGRLPLLSEKYTPRLPVLNPAKTCCGCRFGVTSVVRAGHCLGNLIRENSPGRARMKRLGGLAFI